MSAEPAGVLPAAREVTVTQPLQDAEVTEEDRACFSCELSHEDEELEWSLNGTPLYNDSFHEITHEGHRHTLVLKRVRRGDAGIVRASSPKVTATARLEVKGEASLRGPRGLPGTRARLPLGLTWRLAPLPAHTLPAAKPVVFLKALDDVSAEERGTLTLQCEVSDPQARVVWLKDGVELGPSDKYDFLHTAGTRGLVVHDLSRDDAGLYTCNVGTDETRARVSVHGAWLRLAGPRGRGPGSGAWHWGGVRLCQGPTHSPRPRPVLLSRLDMVIGGPGTGWVKDDGQQSQGWETGLALPGRAPRWERLGRAGDVHPTPRNMWASARMSGEPPGGVRQEMPGKGSQARAQPGEGNCRRATFLSDIVPAWPPTTGQMPGLRCPPLSWPSSDSPVLPTCRGACSSETAMSGLRQCGRI